MHNRIKAIRKDLNLSQRSFGENLGVSRDVINNIESNRVQPKELFLKHICNIYSVNEEWLKTGKGKMFLIDNNIDNNKLEAAISIFKDLQPSYQDYAIEQIKKLLELQENNHEKL